MASHLVTGPSQVFLCKSWHNCPSKVLSCNQQSVWISWPLPTGALSRRQAWSFPCQFIWHIWAYWALQDYCYVQEMTLSRRGPKRRVHVSIIYKTKMWIFVTFPLWSQIIILSLIQFRNPWSVSVWWAFTWLLVHQYQKHMVLWQNK